MAPASLRKKAAEPYGGGVAASLSFLIAFLLILVGTFSLAGIARIYHPMGELVRVINASPYSLFERLDLFFLATRTMLVTLNLAMGLYAACRAVAGALGLGDIRGLLPAILALTFLIASLTQQIQVLIWVRRISVYLQWALFAGVGAASGVVGADYATKGADAMKRLKRLLAVCQIAALCLCLSGCWDMVEINDRLCIRGVGIDVGEQEGMISVTFQMLLPYETSDIQGTPMYQNLTIEAATVSEAVDLLATDVEQKPHLSISRPLFWAKRRRNGRPSMCWIIFIAYPKCGATAKS